MKIMRAFALILGLASPAMAAGAYIQGPTISTQTGTVSESMAGALYLAASSSAINTPIISLNAAATNNFVALIKKSVSGVGLIRFYNTFGTGGSVLDLVATSANAGDYVFQARSGDGSINGLLIRANGAAHLDGPIGLGPNAPILGTGGLLSLGNYVSSFYPIRLYESGTNIYGLGIDGTNNLMRFTAGESGGFTWWSGLSGGVGIATMTRSGSLTTGGYVAAPQLAAGKLYPQSPLDINGVGNISDQINSSIGNFIKNAVIGSTNSTVIVGIPGAEFCVFPGMSALSSSALIVVYHCSHVESVLSGQDGILKYKISTTSGTSWGAEQILWNPGSLATQGVQDQEISSVVQSTVIASGYLSFVSTSAVFTVTGTVSGNSVTWSPTVNIASATFTSVAATSSKAIWLAAVNKWMLPIYGANIGVSGGTAAALFSSDGGVTWGNQKIIADGTGIGGYNETNCIVQSSGRIVCVFRGASGYSRAYSDDNGTTWSAPSLVLTTAVQGRPSFTLLKSSSTLLVARWNGLGTFEPTVYSTSWDYGITWSPQKILSENANDYSSAVVLSSTTIGVVYSDEVNNKGAANIVYRSLLDPQTQPASSVQGIDGNGNSLNLSGSIASAGIINGVQASTGNVGELLIAFPTGNQNLGASGTVVSVATITLTAGDWDVVGRVSFNGGATFSGTSIDTAVSLTANNIDSNVGRTTISSSMMANAFQYIATPPRQILITQNTPVYLVCQVFYTTNGSSTYDSVSYLRARRIR